MKINADNHVVNLYAPLATDGGNRPTAEQPAQSDSDRPQQKEFRTPDLPTRDAPGALAEINDAMTAFTGRGNLRQYDSPSRLASAFNGPQGKILSRRIQNALSQARRVMQEASRRLVDPGEKPAIARYLSAALGTDNATALEQAYERLRNTAFQGAQRLNNLCSADWNAVTFFERRDKRRPLPGNPKDAPLVIANPKDPRKIAINLEVAEPALPELLKQQSSSGYNAELVDAIVGQLARIDGNARDSVPITREQTENGRALGSAQAALADFRASRHYSDADKARFAQDAVYRADEMTANADSATLYLRDIALQRSYNEPVTAQTLGVDAAYGSFSRFSKEAAQLYAGFPDPVKVARTIARKQLRERTGQGLDPDKVYLHQFERSQTRAHAQAYTGYEHNGEPKYSETLTEAYLDNFKMFRSRQTEGLWNALSIAAGKQVANGTYPAHLANPDLTAAFFSNPDELTGLYTDNADAVKFGPDNEVKYRPSDLKNDILDADVMRQVEERQKDFWEENRATWRSLAKGQFIEEARRALAKGALSRQAYETAMKGGASNVVTYDPVTMDELQEEAAPDAGVKANFLALKVPSYVSPTLAPHPAPYRARAAPVDFLYKTNMLCFTGQDGREVVYAPGDEQPFREFANRAALDKWFAEQVTDDSARKALLQHFSLSDRQETVEASLDSLARGLGRRHLKPSLEKVDIGARDGTRDAFAALTKATEARAARDADVLIRSNGEVRLQSAKDLLEIVNLAALPALPMFGPVGMALDMGLQAAQAAVNIGTAATADTPEQRNAALFGAGLNLLFLGIGAGAAARLAGPSARPSLPRPPLRGQPALKAAHSFLERTPARPFGDKLDFPWIDDEIGAAQKALHRQLFARGPSAARLAEFYKNPALSCYDAMVESFDALRKEGAQPKAIGMLMYKNPWDEAPANHFGTLIRKDGAEFVVDPTLRQFDSSLPESSTILPLDQWEALFRNLPGTKDAMIVVDTFDTPLGAKKAVADMHNVAGKYYQTLMMRGDDVNLLKYSDKLENSIISELHKGENLLGVMQGDARALEELQGDIKTLRMLKARLGLLSPDEIAPSTTIRGRLKRRLLGDAVDEAETGAFRAQADDKGVVTSVSGKHYIKLARNTFVRFSWTNADEGLGEIPASMGRSKTELRFDSVAGKWVRTGPAVAR